MKRSTPLRRRKRINPRSAKREAIRDERAALVERLLYERPTCEVRRGHPPHYCKRPCGRRSVHIHEILTRARGGSILDEVNCLAVCDQCHRWIHEHPRAAEIIGALESGHRPIRRFFDDQVIVVSGVPDVALCDPSRSHAQAGAGTSEAFLEVADLDSATEGDK